MNNRNARPVPGWARVVMQLTGIALLILADQLIKQAVYRRLRGSASVTLIPHVLGLTYAENTGAAFSLFSSSTTVLSAVTIVALAGGVAALIFIKKKPVFYDVCVPLIIAGGAGNLIDRLTRGFVIDYIETLFVSFPVFNFADCLITCACIAMILYLIRDMVLEQKKKSAGEAADE